MQDYLTSLLDPFTTKADPPKYNDGKVNRSAAVKLRSTGTIQCNTGSVTWLVLFPGFSHSLLNPENDPWPNPFSGHVASVVDRQSVKQIRVTGAGLRLSLINNADQNEGFWEAVRIPFNISDFPSVNLTTGVMGLPDFLASDFDISSYQTYVTGKMRDLHRYQFKLNSVTTEHPFTDFTQADAFLAANPGDPAPIEYVDTWVDQAFDIVLIKLHGRADAASPTRVMYNTVSTQEVVYKENTALGRLMTPCKYMPNFGTMLTRSNYSGPAVQIN